jgi:hypothetical protein
VSDGDKDYSDFAKHLGNAGNAIAIFAGFTLTTLVLVITRFSDPSAFLVQVILYILTLLFYLFSFLLAWISNLDLFFIKNIPPWSTGMKICSFLEFLGISLLGLVMPALFLFFGLTLLCALSIVTWAVFVTGGYFFTVKPITRIRKQQ